MIPVGFGISQWINRAISDALKRLRLRPTAYPNRLSVPSGGGTMGWQEGSPHVPTQPLEPPVVEPELPQLSLQSPVKAKEEEVARATPAPDWQRYFAEYLQLVRRQPVAAPVLSPPAPPEVTDWKRVLPSLLGLALTPAAFRQGALTGLLGRYESERAAQAAYADAMRDFANRQALAAYQRAQEESGMEQSARREALNLALKTAGDEERRQLQAALEAMRTQARMDIAKINADMEAVSRHMAMANNPALPAEQRAAAYQNAAAILSRYGYEMPAMPVQSSVAERAQALREQMEPQKLALQERRFDLEKWRAQEQVKQGWERIAVQKANVGVSLQRLGLAVQRGQQQEVGRQLRALRDTHAALSQEEQSLMRQLNAVTRDELGRPVPVYNIPLNRQRELLSGAPPQNPTEAQWQDIALRLGEVRALKQQTLPVLLAATVPGAKANTAAGSKPSTPPKQATPVKEVRLPDGTVIREIR